MISNSNNICPICSNSYNTYKGLQGHFSKTHKDLGLDYLRTQIFYNGDRPKCGCGCGEYTEWQQGKGGHYAKYVRYHGIKVRGFWGSKEGLEKSAETRRKRFKSGEIVQYNKGKTREELHSKETIEKLKEVAKSPERRRKISEKLKGRIRSEEHSKKLGDHMRKYWSDPENREKQRAVRMKYIQDNGFSYISSLEIDFKSILDSLGISYDYQFNPPECRSIFDFKIKHLNVLIEIDGDYWHCNPFLEKFKTPKFPAHFENLKRDRLKDEWAELNGYRLIRFWEHDIKNNRLEVVKRLLSEIENI